MRRWSRSTRRTIWKSGLPTWLSPVGWIGCVPAGRRGMRWRLLIEIEIRTNLGEPLRKPVDRGLTRSDVMFGATHGFGHVERGTEATPTHGRRRRPRYRDPDSRSRVRLCPTTIPTCIPQATRSVTATQFAQFVRAGEVSSISQVTDEDIRSRSRELGTSFGRILTRSKVYFGREEWHCRSPRTTTSFLPPGWST
jgi:hypothetical protein